MKPFRCTDDLADGFCELIRAFCTMEPEEGTPLHKFKDDLLAAADIYQSSKTTRCEHSGIEWDKDGKVVGVNP